MLEIKAYAPGIYARSEELVQATRDLDRDRATAEAERILREHQVPPLEPQQEKELDAIMAAAEKELVKRKG